jgi:hypothetical protein
MTCEGPEELASNVTVDGVIVTLKSRAPLGGGELTVTVEVVECESKPLVPVIVIVYACGGVREVVDTTMLELVNPPLTMTVEGLSETVGPLATAGEIVAARLTVPANPLADPFTTTVELMVLPAVSDSEAGITETEKSSLDNFQPVSGWSSQWLEGPSQKTKPCRSNVTEELATMMRGGAHPGVPFQS